MYRNPIWQAFAIASSVCAIAVAFTSMDFLSPVFVWLAHEYFNIAEENYD